MVMYNSVLIWKWNEKRMPETPDFFGAQTRIDNTKTAQSFITLIKDYVNINQLYTIILVGKRNLSCTYIYYGYHLLGYSAT